MSRDVVFPKHIFPYPADIGFVFAPSSLQPITVDAVRDFDDEEHSCSRRGSSNEAELVPPLEPEIMPTDSTASEQLGHGHHQSQRSELLNDYVTYTARFLKNPTHATLTSNSMYSGMVPYPLANYVTCANFAVKHRAFLVTIDAEVDPANFSEAVKDQRWCDAMSQEIRALEENETWKLVSLPRAKRAMGYKWVYRIKYKSDGTVERRLVILGTTNSKELNLPRYLLMWLKWTRCARYLLLQRTRIGNYIRWMLTMRFFMGIWMKKCTWSCRMGSHLTTRVRCAGYKNRLRHRVVGLQNLLMH